MLTKDPMFIDVDLSKMNPHQRNYLSMHACFKKLIDENPYIRRKWVSDMMLIRADDAALGWMQELNNVGSDVEAAARWLYTRNDRWVDDIASKAPVVKFIGLHCRALDRQPWCHVVARDRSLARLLAIGCSCRDFGNGGRPLADTLSPQRPASFRPGSARDRLVAEPPPTAFTCAASPHVPKACFIQSAGISKCLTSWLWASKDDAAVKLGSRLGEGYRWEVSSTADGGYHLIHSAVSGRYLSSVLGSGPRAVPRLSTLSPCGGRESMWKVSSLEDGPSCIESALR